MKSVVRNGIEFLVVDDTKNKNFWNFDSWESDNYQIIKDKCINHTTFVNAGGWIGPFTIFSSKIYKDVYSLEPDTVAYDELKRNVELNNCDNVKIFNKAFYDENTTIEIGSNYSELGGSGTSVFQEKNSIFVESITIKDFFKTELINKKTLLMLDVEGSEYLLFKDFDFFEEYKPTILLSLHLTFLNNENYDTLISSLEKLLSIYDFNIEEIKKNREYLQYGSTFKEINILMEVKK
jgi:FkbM family methyltransferase